MEKQISKGLKNIFLIHSVAGVALGLVYLLIPETFADLVNWPMQEVAPYRLIGAALCGFGTSSWLAFKSGEWERVRILVLAEVIWCGLGTVVMVHLMLTQDLPVIGWINALLFAFFAAAFGYFYQRENRD